MLADVGVDRPAAQRFTDKPYVEIGITDADLDDSPDFSAADGDIVYVSFASPAAKDRAPDGARAATRGASCRPTATTGCSSSTTRCGRPGEGIVAARGILDDLRWLNAPIN